MISVGVRNLKDNLSQYLQYVKNGEKVIITEHNRVIAEISEPSKKAAVSDTEKMLDCLEKEGHLLRAKRTVSVAKKPKITEAEKNIDFMAILDEVRADRF